MNQNLAASIRARLLNIAKAQGLNEEILANAIAATFTRRGMAVPAAMPIGLSDEFSFDPTRQALWHAFLRKNDLPLKPLPAVVNALRMSLAPALLRAFSSPAQMP